MNKTLSVTIAVILSLAVFCCGCGQEKKIKPKLPVGDKIEDIPNFVMQGFRLVSTDKGTRSWEIEGKGAQVFEIKKKIYIQDFLMKNFEKHGKYSTLTGKRAIVDTDTNFMEVNEDVVYKATNGMVLKTKKLYWDDKQKKMYTETEVIIIKEKSVLKGIGFESDASMQNMVIKKQVRLTAKDMQEAVK